MEAGCALCLSCICARSATALGHCPPKIGCHLTKRGFRKVGVLCAENGWQNAFQGRLLVSTRSWHHRINRMPSHLPTGAHQNAELDLRDVETHTAHQVQYVSRTAGLGGDILLYLPRCCPTVTAKELHLQQMPIPTGPDGSKARSRSPSVVCRGGEHEFFFDHVHLFNKHA